MRFKLSFSVMKRSTVYANYISVVGKYSYLHRPTPLTLNRIVTNLWLHLSVH